MTDERDIVNRREDFKRFIVFCLASLVVIAQTAVLHISGMTITEDLFLNRSGEKVTGS